MQTLDQRKQGEDAVDDSTIVCILGMQRNGTSLLARMLNLLGVYLGPSTHLDAPNSSNPKGFWEHQHIRRINEEILLVLGGCWSNPPDFPAGWESRPELADLKSRARDVIEQEFSTSPVWGWKHPATCLTLPFWQQLLPPMRYVICLRHPVDSALSLQRRDGWSLEEGISLWLTHVQFALGHTRVQDRAFVLYEEIIDRPEAELRRVADFVGAPKRSDAGALRRAAEFVDSGLQHHRTPPTAGAHPSSAVEMASDVYAKIRAGYRGRDIDRELHDAREAIRPEAERGRRESSPRWVDQMCLTMRDIARMVPRGSSFILVDNGEIGDVVAADRHAIPFPERHGQYWGPPADDESAIGELERLREAGASHLIVAWPASWWLEYYSGFHRYLRSHLQCACENDRLVAFDLRAGTHAS
jgi:Sulfotransferase family